jgi:hypothetical protein
MTWKKLLIIVVGVVIAGSLLGQSQLAGSVAALVLVVGVLLVVLSGLGGSKKDSLAGFARKATPPADSLFSIVLAGLAAAKITAAPGFPLGVSLVFTVAMALGMGFLPSAAGIVLGTGGGAAAVILAATREDCRMGASTLAVAAAVMVAALLGIVLVVSGVIGVSVPRTYRPKLGDWALLGFGLVSLTLFVASPVGLEVWVDPPPWALAAAFGLILVIGIYSAVQPRLVKALTATAMMLATFILAAYEQIYFGGNVAPCANPVRDAFIAVAFTAIAAPVAALVHDRTGRRTP